MDSCQPRCIHRRLGQLCRIDCAQHKPFKGEKHLLGLVPLTCERTVKKGRTYNMWSFIHMSLGGSQWHHLLDKFSDASGINLVIILFQHFHDFLHCLKPAIKLSEWGTLRARKKKEKRKSILKGENYILQRLTKLTTIDLNHHVHQPQYFPDRHKPATQNSKH